MDGTRLVARLVIGGLLIGHGTQKLFGWFGGSGIEGTTSMMEAIDMHPAPTQALVSGATEAGCGAMLAAGLATPAAAAGITGVMTTAITKVHRRNGVWSSKGGWEYNAVLLAAVASLVETGPGRYSLDHALGTERHGTGWAFTALAIGAGGAALAMRAGRMLRPPKTEPPEPAPTEGEAEAAASMDAPSDEVRAADAAEG